MAEIYEHHPTKQLYPDYNLRTSSFEERGNDVGDQYRNKQTKTAIVDIQIQLSTD